VIHQEVFVNVRYLEMMGHQLVRKIMNEDLYS
jgi:hypothetical protein